MQAEKTPALNNIKPRVRSFSSLSFMSWDFTPIAAQTAPAAVADMIKENTTAGN
jgi:hypothetical protein